jgi:hypothetical protein
MANIRPIDDAGNVQQLPTPYEQGGFSPQAFGAGLGDAVDKGAALLAGVRRKAKDDADTTAVIGAMGSAQDAYNAQVLDHKTGYSALRGEQAVAARDDAIKKYNEALQKIGEGLTTPEQRNHFGRFAITMQERARNHIETHFAQQAEVFATTKYEGTQQSFLRVLAQPGVVDNAGERDRQMLQLGNNAAAEAYRRGEAPALLVGQAEDRGTRTMLDNLLAGKNPNLLEAAQVLGKYGDRLGDDRAKYQKLINDAGDVRQADAKAQEIAKAALQANGQIDIRKAQKLIDALPAGAMKDSVQQRVDHRVVIFDKAWRDEATELAGAWSSERGHRPGHRAVPVANVPEAHAWPSLRPSGLQGG